MKHKYIKDDLFYHIVALLNDGYKFCRSCSKDEMLEYIREHRRVAKIQFKDDDELVKTYIAVIDKAYERPKVESKQPTKGHFVFFYIDEDMWRQVEKNVPEGELSMFIEKALKSALKQEYKDKKKGGR